MKRTNITNNILMLTGCVCLILTSINPLPINTLNKKKSDRSRFSIFCVINSIYQTAFPKRPPSSAAFFVLLQCFRLNLQRHLVYRLSLSLCFCQKYLPFLLKGQQILPKSNPEPCCFFCLPKYPIISGAAIFNNCPI